MGTFIRILIVVICIGVAALIQNYRQLARPLDPPNLDLNEYWGPGSKENYKEDVSVRPFDITVQKEILEDLKSQLARPLRLTEPLEGIGFEYGFNGKALENVVKYWRDTYMPKWNEREAYLKKFPHFVTQIQGLNIHFIREKPKNTAGKKVVPLLLLHGWPGSVREFYDFIPLLTKGSDKTEYVFEVIAPSLPGYGWSQGSTKKAFNPTKIAVIMRNLMLRLGHEKFLVQGGDWGSLIGSIVAALFPENVLGFHSNMCSNNAGISHLKGILVYMMPSFFITKEETEFQKSFGEAFAHIMEESGYFHIQATKPDTIGAALTQNPVGLAGYILEKFSSWTNINYKKLADGGLTKRFTMDALLDNVMIYYVTNSITTSQRLYSEAFAKTHMDLGVDRVAVKVPTGCARFKYELLHSTEFQLKDRFINLVHTSYINDGGHFPAMEVPQKLYNDFITYIQKAL